jgi:DNA-binding SARP family transcriptional activator
MLAPSTLHSTASVARRALGRSAKGVEHLPRSGRLLRLGDTVTTDVERFSRAAADPDPAAWKEALGLVRGRLFDGLTLADWAILEGAQAQVESMVVDTALKGAEHALLLGRGEEAEWMIRRALRICPFDERLYRALLEAAEVMGNQVGMRLAVAELLRVTGDGGPPGTVASVFERAPKWAPAAGRGPARL